ERSRRVRLPGPNGQAGPGGRGGAQAHQGPGRSVRVAPPSPAARDPGVIASVHNRRVVDAARLSRRRDREETRTFLVDGPRAVLAAIRSGASVRQVFHVARSGAAVDEAVQEGVRRGAPTTEVNYAVMARLASTVTPQGVVAVVGFLDVPIRAVGPAAGLVAVLVEVADPGNAGTIVRTADAAGAGAVVCTAG